MIKSPTNSKRSRTRSQKARKRADPRSAKPASRATKTASLLALLSKPDGATIEMLTKAAGWQTHSVRGFLAGHVRKKLGLDLLSEKDAEGPRRYRIIQS